MKDLFMEPASRIGAPLSLQGGVPLLSVIGRMMIGLLFVWSGVFGIVLEWPAVPDMIAAKGLPGPVLLGIGAAGIELLGPLALFHSRLQAGAALVLAAYCVATAILFHNYWTLQEPARLQQEFHFLKNVSLAGALLVIAAHSSRRA